MRVRLVSVFLFILCATHCLSAASFVVIVKDGNGKPVPGVNLVVGYREGMNYSLGGEEGITDADGKFRFSANAYWGFTVRANKEGYYETGEEFSTSYRDEKEKITKLYEQRTVEVVLKEIRDPVPMYWSKVYDKPMPGLGEFFGFDLKHGDWVAPHGSGIEAHCSLRLENLSDDPKWMRGRMTVRFPNEGDGLIPFTIVPREGVYSGSVLQSDYLAPESGYQREKVWLWTDRKKQDRGYYFRVNTVLDEAGNVISANYGKIYNDMEFQFPLGKAVFTWSGFYYNPQVNDRRVEMDRTRPLPDSLLDPQRKDRARHIQKGIEVEPGPLMLRVMP